MLIAPVSLVAGWAWSQVNDTDRFVATYAPLARAPEVHQLIGTALTDEIVQRLGVVGRLSATRQVVANATEAVVSSDAFATAWQTSLRLVHAQLASLLVADPGTLEINDGALQVQLGPFADAVKQYLVGAGVPFASLIPEVNTAITVVQLDADTVATARLAHRMLGSSAVWLPWLALVLAICVVMLWPTKRGGLIVAGCAAMLGAALLALALSQAAAIAPSMVAANVRPVTTLIVGTALGSFASPTLAVFVAGAAAAGTGLLSLPSRD
jgi:hypothetical protein